MMGEHLEDDRHGWRVRRLLEQVALRPAQELQQRGAGLCRPIRRRGPERDRGWSGSGMGPFRVGTLSGPMRCRVHSATDRRNMGPAAVSQLAMTSSASGEPPSVT